MQDEFISAEYSRKRYTDTDTGKREHPILEWECRHIVDADFCILC